jgi:hypothetical protein
LQGDFLKQQWKILSPQPEGHLSIKGHQYLVPNWSFPFISSQTGHLSLRDTRCPSKGAFNREVLLTPLLKMFKTSKPEQVSRKDRVVGKGRRTW